MKKRAISVNIQKMISYKAFAINLKSLVDYTKRNSPTITQVTNNAPPKTLFNPTSPTSVPTKAAILSKTSGAQFPSGCRAMPATVEIILTDLQASSPNNKSNPLQYLSIYKTMQEAIYQKYESD
ncbi:hypothetical protein POM88_004058 [Heracleum sosnowskyi]|uniref:Uncharacterized protein n=1 Tax=Heracleum sosnowskyi TaxID=360622 RepID=A0AAD8JIM3_9APIA|nr:hypothetical protein POM88_004058 [Heracleum sosnowskyi]